MQVWCFVGSIGWWAISADETGANLPWELGPWKFHKIATLDGHDPDEREAEALIRVKGYCCFRANDKT